MTEGEGEGGAPGGARPSSLVTAVLEEQVSPEVAAFMIAKELRPELSIARELEKIDALAEGMGALPEGTSPLEQAQALSAFLYEREGFHGDQESYYDPRNSDLAEVIERRTGIPLTLALVLQAVGRRVGATVDGIGFPGHFLVRVGGEGGVLVDPFFGGRILDDAGIDRLARRMLGDRDRLRPQHLAAVGLRTWAVRMLSNLEHAHSRRGDHAAGMVAADRLVDLTGGAPIFRRQRGLHALALGALTAAAEDLEAYLDANTGAEDEAEILAALSRARSRPSQPPS